MTISRNFHWALSMLVASTVSVSWAEESKLVELLMRTPSPPNAIAYIHNPSLHKLMTDAEMPSSLSENVDQVLLVSDLDTTSLRPRWEAGYALLKHDVTADGLANLLGGYVDTVAGQQVVWSPKHSYLVPAGEKRIGFLRPANRSELSKWLVPTANVNFSEYLNAQSKQPEAFLSLMIAVELKDCFSPIPLEKRIANFTSLKSRVTKDVADILASVKGVSIIVGRRSLNECILTVEFSKSPETIVSIANELLAEILDRNGTSAPEVLSWKTKLEANSLSFQGSISQSSIEGLLGIFTLRDQAEDLSASFRTSSSQKKVPTDNIGYTSKNYFEKIVSIVDRVRKYETKSTGSRARWNDIQARHIDELSTLNVDPSAIDYGVNVAELLRNNALSVRSTNISANEVKTRQGASGRSYGYYNDAYAVSANQIVTDAESRSAAVTDFTVTLSKIDKLTADIRRSLTDIFKIQF